MDIYSSLLATLFTSVLVTPALASAPVGLTHTIPAVQVVKSNTAITKLSKGTLASVNINTADAETLTHELNGIGSKRAQMIVAYREQNGPFKSIDDLLKIKGIGKKIIDKNRGKIIV
ncbi:MAG: helix-hairpin-helix domain-containing protein [Pseudomonadota bacterium]